MNHHAPFRPAYGSGGLVLQDPKNWISLVTSGGRMAVDFSRERSLAIVGAAITASRSSLIPVGEDGEDIAPAIMWQETVSKDIVNRLSQGDSLKWIYQRSGSRPTTLFGAPKMTWLKENRRETYDRAAKLVGIQDYIIKFLTDDFVTDHSFGSRTLLMNIADRVWDPEMLAMFGVDSEKLCRLIPPGSVAGRVTSRSSELTGLPTGLPVVTAGGDQQCAALGMGIVDHGDTILNLGTGSYVITAVERPFFDPRMRVVCNAHAHPERWILDASMGSSGSVHRWFVDNFYASAGSGPDRFAQAERDAKESPPGANGVVVMPHFNGCCAPYWDNRARGGFHGFGLDNTRQDLARAVLEGIACEIRLNLETADELVGRIDVVRMAGGFTQSRFNNQLLADVCQRRMVLPRSHESTARGAWSQAMVALDYVKDHGQALARGDQAGTGAEYFPDPGKAGVYDEVMRTRDRLFRCLQGMHGTA